MYIFVSQSISHGSAQICKDIELGLRELHKNIRDYFNTINFLVSE
jgi:hypothetical protein